MSPIIPIPAPTAAPIGPNALPIAAPTAVYPPTLAAGLEAAEPFSECCVLKSLSVTCYDLFHI